MSASSYARYLWYSAQAEMWKKTVESLEKNNDAKLLDLGCYTGTMALKFAEIIGTTQIYGVDIVDEMLTYASERGIKVYRADLNEALPLPNESMDVITANQ